MEDFFYRYFLKKPMLQEMAFDDVSRNICSSSGDEHDIVLINGGNNRFPLRFTEFFESLCAFGYYFSEFLVSHYLEAYFYCHPILI